MSSFNRDADAPGDVQPVMRSSPRACVASDSDFAQTTAHSLAFTLGLLAIYQEEQEKVYQECMSVVSDGRTPVSSCLCASPIRIIYFQSYEDMGRFTYSLAYE